VALSERLTVEYTRRGVDFVAAPVFGGPSLAEEGRLWVVAAGADRAVDRARPVLEAFSREITVAGSEPRLASAVKLGGSFLAGAMVLALSEALAFAERLGVEPAIFSEAMNHAVLEPSVCAVCAGMMLHGTEHSGESIEVAARDLRLLREAGTMRGIRLSLADSMAGIFAEARRIGPAGQDAALAVYRMAKGGR
jgi:3-hydroxyisobutyrate dehydrogenase-like beta-hydroxyacid dehydrogenase